MSQAIYPFKSDVPIPQSLIKYREGTVEREARFLAPRAALSKDHVRFDGVEDDHRLPYKRDVDRIVHSKAYARYMDKTQVVYLVANDHITHRGLHVQLVSNFARGIAEILSLNMDLVEAIALGHDVGHPPFGHEGEGYLNELSEEYCGEKFTHPLQSCRLFSLIEPLNLGLTVYDGFLCHDGGMCGTQFKPRFGKTWADHFSERQKKQENPEVNVWPGTLEGCLVKMCDTISYIGRDIEDAICLNIIQRSDLPETALGRSNREILSHVAMDIIEQSFEKDYIAMSDEVYEDLFKLRTFNFERFYVHPTLKKESAKIRQSYRVLFDMLLTDYVKNERTSYIWKNYLYNKSERYLDSLTPVQSVIDFIAGMTDNFFVRTLENLLIPLKIKL